MSITNELREWAKTALMNNIKVNRAIAIADRIDAEHERECKEQYACGIGASIDTLMIQTHGYIELPKDADGEYIHVGDEVKDVDYDGHASVFEMRMTADGWWVGAGGICRRPDSYRHYHIPTVEDVMVEFATDWESAQDGEDKTAVLKKYVAKLRLVKEEDT